MAVDVNAIYNSIATQYGNKVAEGLQNFHVGNDGVEFIEFGNGGNGQGESWTVSFADLQLTDAQIAELKEAESTNSTTTTTTTQVASAAQTTAAAAGSSAEIQAELDELNEKKDSTLEMIKEVEEEIKELAEDIERKIQEASEKQEAKVKEHEEEVQKAIKENVEAYVAANKANGEGMTQDELQANVKDSLAGIPEVADVVSGLFVANTELALMDTHLAKLNGFISDVEALEAQIGAKETELASAKAAEAAAASASKSCDPIGFTDAQGNKFDFVKIDEDGFNSTSDFLGAQDQWAEMAALDGKGGEKDGIITLDELRENGIALTMNGGKDLMNADAIAEMFGDDFQIDLGSYDKNGTHDAISAGDHDNDGVADQTLLGTFTVKSSKLGDMNGYNTLDDQDWLAENYGLNANVEQISETEARTKQVAASDDIQGHKDFYEQYTQKAAELRELLEATWTYIGVSDELIQEIDNSAVSAAEVQANEFYAQLEAAHQTKDQAEEGEAQENDEGEDAEDEDARKRAGEEA